MSTPETAKLAVLDLRSGEKRILLNGGSHARYIESGHLAYVVAGTLQVIAFDIQNLRCIGTASPVGIEIRTSLWGAADFDVARDGTLAYAPMGSGRNIVSLVVVNRFGREQSIDAPTLPYNYPRLSPDGRLLALSTPTDLGILDFSNGTMTWF